MEREPPVAHGAISAPDRRASALSRILSAGLPGLAQRVAVALLDGPATLRGLARDLGASKDGISKSLRRLQALGLAEIAALGARNSTYWGFVPNFIPPVEDCPLQRTVTVRSSGQSQSSYYPTTQSGWSGYPSYSPRGVAPADAGGVADPQVVLSGGARTRAEDLASRPAPRPVGEDVRKGLDLRTDEEERTVAVRALLSHRGWLPRVRPQQRMLRTHALVAAYCERWSARGVLLWLEIAERPELRRIRNPAAWVYSQLRGYGIEGWDPVTKAGRRWQWVQAVLEARRDDALRLLKESQARETRRSCAAAERPALPLEPAPRAATPPAPAEPIVPSDPGATRAWLEGLLAAGQLDDVARDQAESWLAELTSPAGEA